MSELSKKRTVQAQRARRTRAKIAGASSRPRLSIHISNMHVSAQIIDDEKMKTVAHATSVGSKAAGTMTEKAATVGAEIAKKAKTNKITQVVLDRGSRRYHGRVKALADAARENGLEF